MINELEVPFDCIGENSEMYKFSVPVKKEVMKIDKDGNKSVELYPTKQNSLIALDLCHVHYQSLLIIYL